MIPLKDILKDIERKEVNLDLGCIVIRGVIKQYSDKKFTVSDYFRDIDEFQYNEEDNTVYKISQITDKPKKPRDFKSVNLIKTKQHEKYFGKVKEYKKRKEVDIPTSKSLNSKTLLNIVEMNELGLKVVINNSRVYYEYIDEKSNKNKLMYVGEFYQYADELLPFYKSKIPVATSSGLKRFSNFGKRYKETESDRLERFFTELAIEDSNNVPEYIRSSNRHTYEVFKATGKNNKETLILRETKTKQLLIEDNE